MDDKIIKAIEKFKSRALEIKELLVNPEVLSDIAKLNTLSKELSELDKKIVVFDKYEKALLELPNLQEMLEETTDLEMKREIDREIDICNKTINDNTTFLKDLLIEKDPNDDKGIFMEIRAAAGGDESAIFAGDLFRMYSRYAEKVDWKIEVVSSSEGVHGGFKEVIFIIYGYQVYKHLKFESGAHRVQRVPDTETQGRVHTSTCTIAVLPYNDDEVDVDIKKEDLRIDTFRASGAGGQHVNKTDSAIRITHIPTGLIVECQEERSQHKNRSKALSLLGAKLKAMEEEKRQKEFSSKRKLLVGTGDRSERIRTYNFPQGRLTDHRIGLTLYSLDRIMEGELQELVDNLYSFYLQEVEI